MAALDRMATEAPAKFCQMMAGLIPQHFKMEHDHTALVLSEEELRAKLVEIRTKVLDSDDDPDLLGPPPCSKSSQDGPRPVVKHPTPHPVRGWSSVRFAQRELMGRLLAIAVSSLFATVDQELS